jgi:hypothetical protein
MSKNMTLDEIRLFMETSMHDNNKEICFILHDKQIIKGYRLDSRHTSEPEGGILLNNVSISDYPYDLESRLPPEEVKTVYFKDVKEVKIANCE